MKKILVVFHSAEASGAPLVTLDICRLLDQQKYRPTAIFPEDGPITKQAREAGLDVEIISRQTRSLADVRGIGAKWRAFRSRCAFYRALKSEIKCSGCDIVYVSSVVGFISLLAATATKTPSVLHVHERLNVGFWQKIRMRFSAWLAHAIVFVSEAGRKEFGIIPPRVIVDVVPNGIDPARFENVDTSQTREEFNFSQSQKVIVCIGYLSEVKGQDILIAAAGQIFNAVPEAVIMLAGRFDNRDPFYQDLQSRIESLGFHERIVFAGERDDIPAILATSKVFVLPSRREDCPVSLLEAMAARVPVVAADVGDVREMLDNGVAGRIIPPENPDALANAAIEALSENEQTETMKDVANRRILSRYSQDVFIKHIESVIDSVLAKNTEHAK